METAHSWQPGSRRGLDSSRGDRPTPTHSTSSVGGAAEGASASRPAAARAGAATRPGAPAGRRAGAGRAAEGWRASRRGEERAPRDGARGGPPENTRLLRGGEPRSSKPRLPRLVHDLSPRREEPFLVVDCGALTGSLI